MSTVPKLDKQMVAETAAAKFAAVEAAHQDDLVDRLRAVSELANSEHDAANGLRPLRDQIALSLALYGGMRALQNTLGVTRTRFYEMRCDALKLTPEERKARWLDGPEDETIQQRRDRIAERARKHHVKRYPTANINWLLDLSQQVAIADATAALARDSRDRMVVELIEQGWTRRDDIAELIGRTVTRITRIKHKAASAA